MRFGHDYMYKTLEAATNAKRKIKEMEMAEALKSSLHGEYPWIDSGNLKRILSQGFTTRGEMGLMAAFPVRPYHSTDTFL